MTMADDKPRRPYIPFRTALRAVFQERNVAEEACKAPPLPPDDPYVEQVMAIIRAIPTETSLAAATQTTTEAAGRSLAALPLVCIEPARWLPLFADGFPIAAAASPSEEHVFQLPDGSIHLSYTWEGAAPGQPAMLRVEWRADITSPGSLWLRFTRRDDPGVVLSEHRLGEDLVGRQAFLAQELRFDPEHEPWAVTIFPKADPV